jgi:alpha/beta superfamily hydrolase
MVRIPVGDAFTLEGEAHLLPNAPAAVVCHPHPAFGGRMDVPLVVLLAESLVRAGWSTVRFNFRGIDGSGGTPTGGVSEHEDVMAAAAWARHAGAPRVALVGYSFGALMAARALAGGTAAVALAAVAFPTTILGDDPGRVTQVERALDRRIPWLFVNGDADQFCEVDRLRAWTSERSWTRLDVLAGRGHFFAGHDEEEVCRRVTDFVTAL